jgi:hypothetical protein
MQKITLTLTNVFDVVRMSAKSTYTRFGFSSGDQTYTGLMIKGHPRIESGMTITAILRKDDDWKTLEGWLDLDTSSCVMPQPPSLVATVLMAFFSFALIYLFLRGQNQVDASAALFGLVIGCVALFCGWQYVARKKIINVLIQLRAAHLQEKPGLAMSAVRHGDVDSWNIDLVDVIVVLLAAVGAYIAQLVTGVVNLFVSNAGMNALLMAVLALGVRKIAQAFQEHRKRMRQ